MGLGPGSDDNRNTQLALIQSRIANYALEHRTVAQHAREEDSREFAIRDSELAHQHIAPVGQDLSGDKSLSFALVSFYFSLYLRLLDGHLVRVNECSE